MVKCRSYSVSCIHHGHASTWKTIRQTICEDLVVLRCQLVLYLWGVLEEVDVNLEPEAAYNSSLRHSLPSACWSLELNDGEILFPLGGLLYQLMDVLTNWSVCVDGRPE
jgi:hypothetical protein